MTVRTFVLMGSLIALAACGSRNTQQLEVRQGPQSQHYLYGSATASPNAITQAECTGVNRFICKAGQQPSGNEFNRNAELYSAGFAGALAVSTAK